MSRLSRLVAFSALAASILGTATRDVSASTPKYTDPSYLPEYDFGSRDEGMYVFALPILSPIDWDHPGTALWSLIRNMAIAPHFDEKSPTYTSTFGHMLIRFKCRDSQGEIREGWGGMSGQNDSSIDKDNLLNKKIGLEALLKAYDDGEVESVVHNKHRIAKTQSLRLRTLEVRQAKYVYYPLKPAQCDVLADYYHQFKIRNYDHNIPVREWAKIKSPQDHLYFGFAVDAYQGYMQMKSGDKNFRLGGGCTSFAVGALKVAGLYNPELDQFWQRELNVPKNLIGGVDPDTGERREVSVFPMMLGDKIFAGWKDRAADRVPLRFYDPEKVWNFMSDAEKCAKSGKCNSPVGKWVQASGQAGNSISSMSFKVRFKADHTRASEAVPGVNFTTTFEDRRELTGVVMKK